MEHQAEAGVPCVAFSVIHCSIVQRDIGGDVRAKEADIGYSNFDCKNTTFPESDKKTFCHIK